MLKLKSVKENFSSIDPQGKESKAHKLWKWLMDNGPKTREEIYHFDRSYSTVLAKYLRNGLLNQENDGRYSPNMDYKFVDTQQLGNQDQDAENQEETLRKNGYELEDIFFKDWQPQCNSFKGKFVSLKNKVNFIASDIEKLKVLEDSFNILVEDFNSRLVSQQQVTDKYKNKVGERHYRYIISMFANSVRDVNKQAIDCKNAIEARKQEIENADDPLSKKYWSRILENGKWTDYKEWNSYEDLTRYMLGEYSNEQRFTVPVIYFGDMDHRPDNAFLGSSIINPMRYRTYAQLQREVKRKLGIE